MEQHPTELILSGTIAGESALDDVQGCIVFKEVSSEKRSENEGALFNAPNLNL
jgi:hypothetical protein